MEIRKAEQQDKKTILEVINLLRLDISDFIWGEDAFVEEQIQKGEYFLAEIGGKVAGIISLRPKEDRMYIETLAVLENCRRQGIGTKLVEFAKQFAKEKNFSFLAACSFYDYNASDFYLNLGFSLLGKDGKYKGHKYHRFEISI